MPSVAREGLPQDIVAIFHASFHPTQGNVIDWSLKASDDVDLNGVEFCCLPSGLHLIDHDVVYFTKGARHGVCVFRKRVTTEDGHRGFRLSSLGILLAESSRPRSWRHLSALKELVNTIYDSIEARGISEPVDSDWDPARQFFEERKVRTSDLSGADVWSGWDQEFDGPDAEPSSCTPTLHLAHFLRLMGASILTLYKHVLGRRRILLYTQPPVEAACNFCQVAADMVYEDQVDGDLSQTAGPSSGPDTRNPKLKSKHQKGIKVLGMVTLHDIRKLAEESADGRGWIACTTDALFLERPQYYDLIIDLTTSAVSKSARPTCQISRLQAQSNGRSPVFRLSTVRFTWSDVKLWTELDRLLQLDADEAQHSLPHYHTCTNQQGSGTTRSAPQWTDPWRLYEDACLVCAGLWMGTWRSAPSLNSWGRVRLEGDDDLSRPSATASTSSHTRLMKSSTTPSSTSPGPGDDAARTRLVLTTCALLQTFHANTAALLARLAAHVPRTPGPVVLTPRDIAAFELGPLSSVDARFLEWLVAEYAGGRAVVVKKGWRDIFGLLFGFGGS
ncbi:hypothetical protein DENSPDRAFT_902320 [Dentipellis sp. KUC8613]|nr:hypothetical protein DENSPDRAFT_902320 [Dentipellis sp. KUC8613]